MIEQVPSRSGWPVLKIDGRWLASQVDPIKEADRWCDSVSEHMPGNGPLVVLGLGCGYHVLQLKRRFPYKRLVVVECEADCVEFFNSTHSLDAVGVSVLVGSEVSVLAAHPLVKDLMSKPFSLVRHLPSCQLDESFYNEVSGLFTGRSQRGFQLLMDCRPWLQRSFSDSPTLKLAKTGLMSLKDLAHQVKPEERTGYLALQALRELIK